LGVVVVVVVKILAPVVASTIFLVATLVAVDALEAAAVRMFLDPVVLWNNHDASD